MSRLGARWQAKAVRPATNGETISILASDGRPEIYDRQAQRWESFAAEIERETAHAVIDTTWPLSRQIERALAALKIPRLASWLD